MAINEQIPDGGLARDWLDCAKLISPVDCRSEHDHYSNHVRVRGTDLLASQDPLPTLPIGATTVLQDLAAVSAALKRHQPFTIRKLSAIEAAEEAARRRPLNGRQLEEQARNEAAQEAYDRWDDARAERAKQPQTPEERRKWSLDVREPGTPAPPARGRPGDLSARSHDGGVSEEYARINEWMDDTQIGSGARGEA